MDRITRMFAEIEVRRAAMKPEDRAALEAAEIVAQRESWVRAMAPCEHGDPDWETCPKCRGWVS
jgi:hypothetical protein